LKTLRFKLFVILLFIGTKLFSQNAIIVPAIYYDETNKKIAQEKNINSEIYEYLQQYWFQGLLSISKCSEETFGEVNSVIDAQRVCEVSKSTYIVYGYLQQKLTSWYGNLKIYDSLKKKIVHEIFVSDSINEYERFTETLKERVLEGFESIIGMTASENERGREFELDLPISAFYWNPIDEKWRNAITGIAGGFIGLEFYPPLENSKLKKLKYDFSFRFTTSYLYGIGKKENYPLNYHSVNVKIPFIFHIYLSQKNSFYIGTGPYYEYEILLIEQKYREIENFSQNMFGMENLIGYKFQASKRISFFFETSFDFHFKKDSYIDVKSGLGMNIRLCGKNNGENNEK